MKKILLSVHPKYCELIFNGSKTIEVRKNAPKLEPPFEVLVYCTKRGRPLVWGTPCVYYVDERLTQTYGYSFAEAERIFDEIYNGKVIGSFVCDRVFELKINGDDCGNYWHEWDDEGDIQDMCLSYEELETYLGKSVGHGWHITEPKLFDKPKGLSEFKPWCEKSRNIDDNLEMCCSCLNSFCDEDGVFYDCGLTRPPQSWCYVEED